MADINEIDKGVGRDPASGTYLSSRSIFIYTRDNHDPFLPAGRNPDRVCRYR